MTKYYDSQGIEIVKDCIIEINNNLPNNIHLVRESPHGNLYFVDDKCIYYHFDKDSDFSNIKVIGYKNE